MVDTLRPVPRAALSPTSHQPGTRSPLALEIRALADDLVGSTDRDAMTLEEEALVAEVIEEAVAAALPRIVDVVDDELTPRLESLPLHARLALAESRRRGQLGLD